MKVTGTIINYYIHCKRQCYLFANRINLENNSESVHIGKALHEERLKNNKHKEIMLENIRIDRLTKQYLTEIKKSDADVEAAKWQLYYYLYVLKKYGIIRKGRLEFIERKKTVETFVGELTDEIILQLEEMIKEIDLLLNQEQVPSEKLSKNKCKKCAYYEYCYL